MKITFIVCFENSCLLKKTANTIIPESSKLIIGVDSGLAGEALSCVDSRVDGVSYIGGVPVSLYTFDGDFDGVDICIQAKGELEEFNAVIECGDEVHPDFYPDVREAFSENTDCIGAVIYDTTETYADSARPVFAKKTFVPDRNFLVQLQNRFVAVHVPKVLLRCPNSQ